MSIIACGFRSASALGGAAVSFETLVLARTLQGSFGAVLPPSALDTLVSTSVTRASAAGVAFFASAAVGGGAGAHLGGI